MRNMLALIGAAVVLFVGLGYHFQWYSFVFKPGTDGKQHIEVDVDTKKISEDAKKLSEQVGEAVKNGAAKDGKADFVGPPAPADMPMKPPSVMLPGPGRN